jgi:hypothetical protein
MAKRKQGEKRQGEDVGNPASARTERIRFRVTPEEKRLVELIAAGYGVSQGDALRCVLKVFVRELKKEGSLAKLMKKPRSWEYAARIVGEVEDLLMGLEVRPKRRCRRVM